MSTDKWPVIRELSTYCGACGALNLYSGNHYVNNCQNWTLIKVFKLSKGLAAVPLNTGCLQLLEILEIYWNLKTLLEILEISLNLMVILEIFV